MEREVGREIEREVEREGGKITCRQGFAREERLRSGRAA